MKNFRLFVVIIAAVAVLSSCKSEFYGVLSGHDIDAKYEMGFDLFSQEKYLKSAQLFESLSLLVEGTPREDTVLYYWGLSNYNFGDYYTAESNFNSFITKFPRSPFTEDATFLRIDCLYRQTLRWELDQTPTYATMSAISRYLTDYPLTSHLEECSLILDDLGERLDKKAFENARLYYKMEDYVAARVALKNVLKEDADNIYREDVLYYTAMASYKYAQMSVPEKQRDRYLLFIDDYLNFMGEYPESAYSKELNPLYNRVQRLLGRSGGVVVEDVDLIEEIETETEE